MQFRILLLCFFSSLTFLQAQTSAPSAANPGSISGKVIDKTSKQPIPYVNISVKQADKVITGGITQDNGNFSIKNLPLESFTVEILFMGYKKETVTVTLTSATRSVNLNTISLEEEAVQLKGVDIVSERSTMVQKIDRKVINIGKDLIASGNTASEIMNNIPTVSIDPQTKEISLRGNTNVRILIDGKPSNIDATQLLQQIPSSSIKQIELITNPSAKYNPEGMSGIINIILNKNANEGFNGSLNSGVTFSKTPKVNTALNLNYKVGKVNMYTNYGLNHGKNQNHGNISSERPNLENTQLFEFDNLNTSHLVKVGLDYLANDNNTFSFYTNLNFNYGGGNGQTLIDYLSPTNSDSQQLFDSKSDNNTQTYDFVYKHNFKKVGENIEFQSNYSKTTNPENTVYDYTTTNPISQRITSNDIERDIDYLQVNLDYVNPISETIKLELGAESRIQKITNDFFENVDETTGTYTRTGDSDFIFKRNTRERHDRIES